MNKKKPDAYFADLKRRLEEALVKHPREDIRDAATGLAVSLTDELLEWTQTRLNLSKHTTSPEGIVRVAKSLEDLRQFLLGFRGPFTAGFEQAMRDQERHLEALLGIVKAPGGAPARGNLHYNEAGAYVAAMLKYAGAPYAAAEAAEFLWQAGFAHMREGVTVIDPYKHRTRQRGKHARDPLESEARNKWGTHLKRIALAREEGEPILLGLAGERKLESVEEELLRLLSGMAGSEPIGDT